MEKKYLIIEGIKLAYLEKNPAAQKTIFFIHGNSTSSKIWYKQFYSKHLDDYRLIAFDLPLHGDSGVSKKPNWDYDNILLFFARVAAKTIDRLAKGQEYITIGFSYASNIIAEAVRFGLKPQGIIFMGPSVFGKLAPLHSVYRHDRDLSIFFKDEVSEFELDCYIEKEATSLDTTDIKIVKEAFMKVKAPSRSSIGRIATLELNDEIEALDKLGVPLLLFVGSKEQITNPDYLDHIEWNLWNRKIYKFHDATHFVHLERFETVNKLIAVYANERLHTKDNSFISNHLQIL